MTPIVQSAAATKLAPLNLYLAGPMTGLPDYNFPSFYDAADALRDAGHYVMNPAENFGGRTDLDRSEYLKKAYRQVLDCDAIALLPGWEQSAGASTELRIAMDCGKTVYYYGPDRGALVQMPSERTGVAIAEAETYDDEPPAAHAATNVEANGPTGKETILDEAKRIVFGDRNDDYGHPREDFARTAMIWSAILGVTVRPEQVGLCMIGVKLSRHVHQPKRDNMVDVAGYAQAAWMCQSPCKS